MADISQFSAVRDGVRSNHQIGFMHSSSTDFFRIDVAAMLPMVPKDVFSVTVKTFIDSAPNPYPISGSMKYGQYAFFVPYRILWPEWKFYINHLQGLTQPYFTLGDLWDVFHDENVPWVNEGLVDEALRYISNVRRLGAIIKFLKVETKSDIPSAWLNLEFNAYALRALNRIWWDWFRDKAHISDAAEASYCYTSGGHISQTELAQLCSPKYRCYHKNYITTAFESPQEGSSSVQPVRVADSVRNPSLGNTTVSRPVGVMADGTVGKLQSENTASTYPEIPSGLAGGNGTTTIGQFDVSNLKLANSWQNLKEKLLVAGKTVVSRGLALFNTHPTIEELQMSNYLGGHEEDLYFDTQTVQNTTAFTSDRSGSTTFGMNPYNGNVAGQKFQNIKTADNKGYGLENVTYSSDETGFLVIVGIVTPVVQYFQGLPRDWFRGTDTFAKDVTDYFHSDMENQPLQPVLNYEVVCSPYCSPKGVYGFQQNYIDYKLEMDSVGGDYCVDSSKNAYKQMFLGRNIEDELLEIMEGDHFDEFLTPANLVQTDYSDRNLFDRFFTVNYDSDHFRIDHKITVNANRPMMECTLPSLDSALSQQAKKKLVETGGLRL